MILSNNYMCFVHIIFLLGFCSWTKSEVFTAISDVEPLLKTHEKIINDLDDYIKAEEKRLATIKRTFSAYTREHEKAMEDIPNYLGNPINAFTLLKRLTVDLELMRQNILSTSKNMRNITTKHDGLRYPVLEDLTGAAEALTRLQETYKLDVHDLSEGILNGVVYSNPMTTEDCFEIGRALYNEQDYQNSLAWMMEGLRKYKENVNGFYNVKESEFMEYISLSHYFLGDVKSALEWTEKLVEIDPKHPRAAANILLYKSKLAEQAAKAEKHNGEIKNEPATNKTLSEEELQYAKEYKDYEIICRGEMEVPAVIAKRLKCRYLTENHPFLKLAPIKMEYVYLQPDVIVFHDVMSDGEIQVIQKAAKPRFKRAAVQNVQTGALVPAKYRISKSAWIEDWESPVVAKVSQRVADMTGLSMATAESLQVVNYGIGGHYLPHYDFTTMSNVTQGGATAFTKLGLGVFPKKGAAAFWFNLHPSGEGDLATRHAACPVLLGSKWVSNKWIHENTQEFIRPCTLDYQKEGVHHKIRRPVLNSSR